MSCDRCGADEKLTAAVEIRWSFQMDGKTLFGGVLGPNSAKRTLCPKCFEELCKVTAKKMEVCE